MEVTAPKGITVAEAGKQFAAFLNPQTEPPKEEPEETQETVDENTSEETATPTEEQPEETSDAQESPTYKVRVDGEEVDVPLDELLRGYSRTSDYTRKTQKLAEERKAYEAETAAVREERQRYANVLQTMESQLTATKEPDWAKLFEEDPIEASKQFAMHQSRKEQLAQVRAEQKRVAEANAQEQQRQLQTIIAEEEQKLVSKIKEWSDPKKAKAEKETVLEYARSLGYTDTELSQLYDHRAVIALREAALYRQMATNAQGKVEKSKDNPKTLKPGNTPSKVVDKNLKAAKSQFASAPTVQNAAAVFKQTLFSNR